jgi:type VI protein secretion system component VasF
MEHRSFRLPSWVVVLLVTVLAVATLIWFGAEFTPVSAATAVEYAV